MQLVNIISNVILIPKLEALGASIAIVFAEASVTLSQVIFIRGKLTFDISGRTVVLYFADAVLMMVLVVAIGKIMGPRLLTNLVQVACGAVLYLGILTVFKEEFHMAMIQKVLEMVKR